jgi:glucose/mannose-6-phosphate isomerase
MPWTAKERLHIFSSYSGNTEEILDGLSVAREQGLNLVIVTSGGKLLETAKEFNLPHIILPGGVQPRMALGYFIKGISLLISENLGEEITTTIQGLDATKFEEVGERIAGLSSGKPFLIYSSNKDSAVGYIWKIKLNENAKHSAFSNSIPEANHNEIEYLEDEKERQKFFPIFIMDSENNPKIARRMEVLMKINETYGISQSAFELFGKCRLEKILGGILLADFTSLALAKEKEIDPEKVSILEEFKEKIKN